ncbi:MAG: SDR family NAD(P)-dependent oxidoreductase [Candidatus Lustribacter sp.]|jgi:3-oxoacyl-[acyl-carrier protein] reductase
MMNGAPTTVDLAGRTALVTGAASGIGLACAQLLAKSGAAVVIADINGSGAQSVRDELAASGCEALAIEVDVSSSAAVNAMVDQTIARYGKIDILVHCAGGGVPRCDVVDMTDETWHKAIGVNLDGSLFVTRAVARTMVPRRAGTMVLIASDRGLLGDKSRAGYAASKGGVIALVKTLALELGKHEITVNALNPGTTNTPAVRSGMTPELREQRLKTDPLGKMSEPEEVAQTVLFMAGPAASYMTGQLITTRMRAG